MKKLFTLFLTAVMVLSLAACAASGEPEANTLDNSDHSVVSGNILVAELRTVNFIDALVSILTLQNTLITISFMLILTVTNMMGEAAWIPLTWS